MYASEVFGVDAQIGRLVNDIKTAGMWDRTILVFGEDHGEELFAHNSYGYHDCSYYDQTVGTTWLVRAPGQALTSGTYDPWVSTVDITPTILDLAGVPFTSPMEGMALTDVLLRQENLDRPVFFERSQETAGVVYDGHTLVHNEALSFPDCDPFSETSGAYETTENVEMYDLVADPSQSTELSDSDPDLADNLTVVLCDWVNTSYWDHNLDGGDRMSNLSTFCKGVY